jgi:hypothetical protein
MADDAFERANRRNKKPTWDEYQYLKENCKNCSEVGAQMFGNADFSENGVEMPSVSISGVTLILSPSKTRISSRAGSYRRTKWYEQHVFASSVTMSVKSILANVSPIGKTWKLRGVPLTIVGLEDKRGQLMGSSFNRVIYIPVTLHAQIFGSGDNGIPSTAKAEARNFDAAIEEARVL